MQITRQCTDGVGTYFAYQICFLACHYQLFEQLPLQKQGQYLNRLLLNNEQVQTAARTYLTSLTMGGVTLKHFCLLTLNVSGSSENDAAIESQDPSLGLEGFEFPVSN